MKRYILIVFSLILFCNLAQAADLFDNITFDKDNIKQIYQQDLKELSIVLEKEESSSEKPFKDTYVKNMCKAWPSCQNWANNKLAKDPTFQLVDVEVECWVSRWVDNKAVWEYRFYAQTKEKGQIKAYLFKQGKKGQTYPAPVLIRQFPGHPILKEPLEVKQGKGIITIVNESYSQYIYKYDDQGRALWKVRHYIQTLGIFYSKYFYLQAYQTEAGGNFVYQDPIEMKAFPKPSSENEYLGYRFLKAKESSPTPYYYKPDNNGRPAPFHQPASPVKF